MRVNAARLDGTAYLSFAVEHGIGIALSNGGYRAPKAIAGVVSIIVIAADAGGGRGRKHLHDTAQADGCTTSKKRHTNTGAEAARKSTSNHQRHTEHDLKQTGLLAALNQRHDADNQVPRRPGTIPREA